MTIALPIAAVELQQQCKDVEKDFTIAGRSDCLPACEFVEMKKHQQWNETLTRD